MTMWDLYASREQALQAEIERMRAARWKPGDPRCDACDNGLEKSWVYCPFCAKFIQRSEHGRKEG